MHAQSDASHAAAAASSASAPVAPPAAPHSRCNPLSTDGRLLLGAVPTAQTLPQLLSYGVRLFVNLDDDVQGCWYHAKLPAGTQVIHMPTPSGRAPTLRDAIAAVQQLQSHYAAGGTSYMHCNGGHGRAGTLGALLLGRLHGLSAVEAISAVERWRGHRPDTSRNFIPTPETDAQVRFVVQQLGLKEGEEPLSRTDKQWIKRVKQERKKRGREQTEQQMREQESLLPFLAAAPVPAAASAAAAAGTSPPAAAASSSSASSPVLFYTDRAFPELSNYFQLSSPMLFEGARYVTSEHAFQAAKFIYAGASAASLEYGALIRTSSTPNKARVLAAQKTAGGYAWRVALNAPIISSLQQGVTLRADWDSLRDQVMRDVLMAKFKQDAHCRRVLLATGERPLVEHTPRDAYWGNGKDGKGLNKLGKLLEGIRQHLRQHVHTAAAEVAPPAAAAAASADATDSKQSKKQKVES